MFKVSNPFKLKNKEQADNALMDKVTAQKEIEEIQKLAHSILGDERYLQYREAMDVLLKKTLVALINYDNPDNNAYACEVKALLSKINTLIAFLDYPVNVVNYVSAQRVR